ncbi:MAG TPA: hypothetical protein VET88_00380 [Gammaproteobacteria bacterium]|nr:hypothetical protein [Gammaproteobacteria bacterium]
MSAILAVGDRIRIGGGYDMAPRWLNGRKDYTGTVRAFIPGQNDLPAAVVALDDVAVFDETTGSVLVLELRYAAAEWTEQGTVHVELCDFVPEHKAWQDRKQGKWVESHAGYTKL